MQFHRYLFLPMLNTHLDGDKYNVAFHTITANESINAEEGSKRCSPVTRNKERNFFCRGTLNHVQR